MARGFDSKAVEDQIAEGQREREVPRRLEAARLAQTERQRQMLELQRERVLSERTSSPVRRAALEAALKQIEEQLQQLS